ncbi:MAG: Uma2 family endonuclease [Gammaproteobacteria bacterium]
MPVATKSTKFTSADLELMPEDGKRYELIEGELHMSRQPGWEHQYTCGRLFKFLDDWNAVTGAGVVNVAPGLIFAEDDDVAPDVVWISRDRFASRLDEKGHLQVAPELVVEVLSPGAANERRDRQAKLKLYSRQGVQEYWIVDWMRQQIGVYRREQGALGLVATLYAQDTLETPLLPGFVCQIARLFFSLPAQDR